MNIVLVGQQWLGVEALKICLQRGDTILKVLTPPARHEEYDRLYAYAQQRGLPVSVAGCVIEDSDIPPGTDLILAAHAHAFISAAARGAARYGALGYHPSLLPRHRGRDAVRWTIHMRDPIAGGSVYWMDDGADTGPIAAQDWCHVLPNDDARTLWRRELAPMGIRLISRVLAEVDTGMIGSVAQVESVATWEPSFSKATLRP